MGKAKPAAVIETLADLTPDPRNARRHNPRNVGMLEKALGEVGAARSIVIDEHGVVLAGNATIEAAGRAGIERVQVVDADGETIIAVRRTGLTAKQKTRLALYDNRTAELADWDADVIADLLATERELLDGLFADDELAELLDDLGDPETTDAEPQMDRAAELNKKWQVQAGDLWRIGEHRLLCGDSTKREDVARVMGGEKAGACITDPPYNIGKDFGKGYDDNKKDADYISFCLLWFSLIGEGVPKAIFTGSLHCGLWWNISAPRALIAWTKPNGQGHNPFGGTTKWEPILVWNPPHDKQTDLIEHNNEYGNKVSELHATPKPVGLIQKIMKRFVAEIYYEPFCGTGTAILAAQNLSRRCYAIEISADYCAVILERMATAFPALAIERA